MITKINNNLYINRTRTRSGKVMDYKLTASDIREAQVDRILILSQM